MVEPVSDTSCLESLSNRNHMVIGALYKLSITQQLLVC